MPSTPAFIDESKPKQRTQASLLLKTSCLPCGCRHSMGSLSSHRPLISARAPTICESAALIILWCIHFFVVAGSWSIQLLNHAMRPHLFRFLDSDFQLRAANFIAGTEHLTFHDQFQFVAVHDQRSGVASGGNAGVALPSRYSFQPHVVASSVPYTCIS